MVETGNVVNSNVFVCFCMAEGRTCRKVSCFCVFLLGRTGGVSKNNVFLCVFWVKSKSVVFLCVFGFCVFLLGGTEGNVEKCRVCRKCRVFVCFCLVQGGEMLKNVVFLFVLWVN